MKTTCQRASLFLAFLWLAFPAIVRANDEVTVEEAKAAMKRAAKFYHDQLAVKGGYVYFYSLDNGTRWGEGKATDSQVWVQPPGTPTVGLAFLFAYRATGDESYRDAAAAAAEALVYGQLKSGGWTNAVDFDPRGSGVADYLNGRGRGKNNSSLDDGQTQSALRMLIQADHAHRYRHPQIRAATQRGLDALLAAQFPNGGFPQVWTGPVATQPAIRANFPKHDWRTEGRIKNYWDMYTLNDNVVGYVVETLLDAHRVYGKKDQRYLDAMKNVGDFLILAQLPAPQPAWAQQYNYQMQPIWARRFEPAAVASDETQEAIATLLTLYRVTGEARFLSPIPEALKWLKRSRLPSGQLARYYELETNRPLYMTRNGKQYSLTYSDANLPSHYGWKIESRIEALEADFAAARKGQRTQPVKPDESVREIIDSLDAQGRWVERYDGRERLVGQAKMTPGERYLSSETFSRRLRRLARFIAESQ